MPQKPKILVVLALLHFLAPIGNAFFNGLLLDALPGYMWNLIRPEYLLVNWPMIVTPLVAGVAIYSCQRWSFYVYLGAAVSLFLFSVIGYLSKMTLIGLGPLVFVFTVNILVVGYFLIPAVREVYFDSRLRWWERSARYQFNQRCVFRTKNQSGSGTVANISRTGLLLEADEPPLQSETIEIVIPWEGDQVSLIGDIVYQRSPTHQGTGVKFQPISETKQKAKKIVQFLDAQGKRLPTSSETEENFAFWLRNLMHSGKGLLPEKVRKPGEHPSGTGPAA